MISVKDLENQIKENDISLLIQIPLSKETSRRKKIKMELLQYAKRQIPQISTVYPDLRLSLALVLLAKQIYDQGNFWRNLSEILKLPLSENKRVKLGQIFLATLRKYNLYEIQKHKDSNEYVQNILAHCIVPEKYLENYFEFLYSFYDRNLGRYLPDDIDEDIKALKQYMQQMQNTQDEDLHFERSKSHSAVSYKLIKSTQTVIAECDNEVIYDQIIQFLELIDDYFYNNSTANMKPRLIKWCENKFEKYSQRNLSNYRHIQRFRNSTPFIGFNIGTNRAYIVIPERKFDENTREAKIEIYKDGKEYFKTDIELCQAYGYVKSDDVTFIDIDKADIFSEFTIYCNNKLIKKIDSQYFRIFQEIKNSNLDIDYYEIDDFGVGELCILTPATLPVELNTGIFLYKERNDYFSAHIVNVQKNTVLLIDGIPLDVAEKEEEESPYKIFYNAPENFYLKTEDDRIIQSTYSHPKIYFKNPQEFLSQNPFIWCNQSKFNLQEHIEYKKPSSGIEYAMIDLNKLVENEVGEYVVQIDIPGHSQKSTLCKYLVIDDLEFKTNKQLYMFDTSAIITKISEHYIQALNSTIIKGNNCQYEFKISNDTVARFEIELAENVYTIEVPLKVFEYSFDKKRWFKHKKEYIWNYELENFLYVKIPNVSDAALYLDNDSHYPIYSSNRNGYLEFDISRITKKANDNTPFNDILNIEFKLLNRTNKFKISNIINQINIKKFNFSYDKAEKSVYIDTEFESGKYGFYVTIINVETDEKHCVTLQNGKNYLKDLDSQGIYNIKLYMEKTSLFGDTAERTFIKQISKKSPTNVLFLPANCQITIKDLYYENIRYPLINYSYQIAKTRAYPNYYWGVLYPMGTPVIFDFVQDDRNKIFFKPPEDDYFCYDTKEKALIPSKMLKGCRDYDRFLFLDYENTYFNVTIKEKRKEY